MLNYLSKDCLRGVRNESTLSWSISAESFRTSDARVLGPDVKASLIIKSLDRYIANWRQSMTDASGEQVDLAHMCVTTLGYLNGLLIPDVWTGWTGDLASAMGALRPMMEAFHAVAGAGSMTSRPPSASTTLTMVRKLGLPSLLRLL